MSPDFVLQLLIWQFLQDYYFTITWNSGNLPTAERRLSHRAGNERKIVRKPSSFNIICIGSEVADRIIWMPEIVSSQTSIFALKHRYLHSRVFYGSNRRIQWNSNATRQWPKCFVQCNPLGLWEGTLAILSHVLWSTSLLIQSSMLTDRLCIRAFFTFNILSNRVWNLKREKWAVPPNSEFLQHSSPYAGPYAVSFPHTL